MIAPPLEIYTDGSCLANPGGAIGFSAVVTQAGMVINQHVSGYKTGTSNQAELLAVIMALSSLAPYKDLVVYSDSQYVIKGMTEWKPNRLKKMVWKDKVPNEKMWRQLDDLASKHTIRWVWVKGHNGNHYNEIADRLANEEAHKFKETAR
jgi:ribonuclease HI